MSLLTQILRPRPIRRARCLKRVDTDDKILIITYHPSVNLNKRYRLTLARRRLSGVLGELLHVKTADTLEPLTKRFIQLKATVMHDGGKSTM